MPVAVMTHVLFAGAQVPYSVQLLGPDAEPRVHADPPPLRFGAKRYVDVDPVGGNSAPASGATADFKVPIEYDNILGIEFPVTWGAITASSDNAPAFVDGLGLAAFETMTFKSQTIPQFTHTPLTLWYYNERVRAPGKKDDTKLLLGLPRSERVALSAAAVISYTPVPEFEDEGLPTVLMSAEPTISVKINSMAALINQISTTTGLEVARTGATIAITNIVMRLEIEDLSDDDRAALTALRDSPVPDKRTGRLGLCRKFRRIIYTEQQAVTSSDSSATIKIYWGAPLEALAVMLRTTADVARGVHFLNQNWTSWEAKAGGDSFVPLRTYDQQVRQYTPGVTKSNATNDRVFTLPYQTFGETFWMQRSSTGHFNPQILSDPKVIVNFTGFTGHVILIGVHEAFWVINPRGVFDITSHVS